MDRYTNVTGSTSSPSSLYSTTTIWPILFAFSCRPFFTPPIPNRATAAPFLLRPMKAFKAPRPTSIPKMLAMPPGDVRNLKILPSFLKKFLTLVHMLTAPPKSKPLSVGFSSFQSFSSLSTHLKPVS